MVIFIKGALNVLDYFIDNISKNVQDAFIINLKENNSMNQLYSLIQKMNETTIVVTFNNLGLTCNYDNQILWDKKNVTIYNYIVDPPQWYTGYLDLHIRSSVFITVDRMHCDYIHKFYPDQKCFFLPHGGVRLDEKEIPYLERKYDVVYMAGNKTQAPIKSDVEKIVYDLLVQYPSLAIDEVFDLVSENQGWKFDLNVQNQMIQALYENVFYSVKKYYQEQIITAIANAGIHFHLFGNGWDLISDNFPVNVTVHDSISPQDCIYVMQDSRIVLNILPWFKDGAHERIFNAMLNGSVCLTDESKYLKERFTDMENIVFYQLEHLEELGDKIKMILSDPDLAQCIIYNQKKAVVHDTWQDRMNEILNHHAE